MKKKPRNLCVSYKRFYRKLNGKQYIGSATWYATTRDSMGMEADFYIDGNNIRYRHGQALYHTGIVDHSSNESFKDWFNKTFSLTLNMMIPLD